MFWRPLRGEQRAPDNATHPKTQIFGTVSFLRFRVCRVFGCFLFSSDFLLGNFAGHLAGISRDFFGPTKQRLTNIGEIFGAFFVTKLIAQKSMFVPNSLCRCATLSKLRIIRADFRAGHEDSNFSVFRVRRFSESPEPLH